MIFGMKIPLIESFGARWISSGRWIWNRFDILLLVYLTFSLTPVWNFLTDAFFSPDVAWPYIFFLWPSYTFVYGYAIVAVLMRSLKGSMRIPLILCLNLALLVSTYWVFKVMYGLWAAASLTYTFLNYVSLACILLHVSEPLLRGEMKLSVKITITATKVDKGVA
jgi:hypothetical protein